MEKLDLNDVLFHGLAHYLTYKRFNLALKRLDQILKSNAILSRNEQKKILPTLGLKFQDYEKTLWNGEDYISVCRQSGEDCILDNSEAFFEFVEGGIGFVLDKSLLKELDVRLNNCQDGEIQVKDRIDSKYFLGIFIRDMSDEEFLKFVKDWPGVSDESIHNRFVNINKVRDVLQQNGYGHLPIYSAVDGKIITNAQSIISQLEQCKDL